MHMRIFFAAATILLITELKLGAIPAGRAEPSDCFDAIITLAGVEDGRADNITARSMAST